MRPISRRVALWALGVATLAACRPGETTEKGKELDLSTTDNAVTAANPRVVSVEESTREIDGLGSALYLRLRFDSESAASVDDLDAIVAAIWQSSPFEPNAIRLEAVADGAGQVPVDLRAAAAGLAQVLFNTFGQGGIALIGMQKRYGDWKGPA